MTSQDPTWLRRETLRLNEQTDPPVYLTPDCVRVHQASEWAGWVIWPPLLREWPVPVSLTVCGELGLPQVVSVTLGE